MVVKVLSSKDQNLLKKIVLSFEFLNCSLWPVFPWWEAHVEHGSQNNPGAQRM